jgi:hypothetical protein
MDAPIKTSIHPLLTTTQIRGVTSTRLLISSLLEDTPSSMLYCWDNAIYPSLWEVKSHWLDTVLLYAATDQDIAFLVPDSCTATVKNAISISVDVWMDIAKTMIRTTLMFALFRQFGCCFVFFLHCMINNVKFVCTLCETGQKSSPKTCTNRFNVFRKCTYIVYM